MFLSFSFDCSFTSLGERYCASGPMANLSKMRLKASLRHCPELRLLSILRQSLSNRKGIILRARTATLSWKLVQFLRRVLEYRLVERQRQQSRMVTAMSLPIYQNYLMFNMTCSYFLGQSFGPRRIPCETGLTLTCSSISFGNSLINLLELQLHQSVQQLTSPVSLKKVTLDAPSLDRSSPLSLLLIFFSLKLQLSQSKYLQLYSKSLGKRQTCTWSFREEVLLPYTKEPCLLTWAWRSRQKWMRLALIISITKDFTPKISGCFSRDGSVQKRFRL